MYGEKQTECQGKGIFQESRYKRKPRYVNQVRKRLLRMRQRQIINFFWKTEKPKRLPRFFCLFFLFPPYNIVKRRVEIIRNLHKVFKPDFTLTVDVAVQSLRGYADIFRHLIYASVADIFFQHFCKSFLIHNSTISPIGVSFLTFHRLVIYNIYIHFGRK